MITLGLSVSIDFTGMAKKQPHTGADVHAQDTSTTVELWAGSGPSAPLDTAPHDSQSTGDHARAQQWQWLQPRMPHIVGTAAHRHRSASIRMSPIRNRGRRPAWSTPYGGIRAGARGRVGVTQISPKNSQGPWAAQGPLRALRIPNDSSGTATHLSAPPRHVRHPSGSVGRLESCASPRTSQRP